MTVEGSVFGPGRERPRVGYTWPTCGVHVRDWPRFWKARRCGKQAFGAPRRDGNGRRIHLCIDHHLRAVR